MRSLRLATLILLVAAPHASASVRPNARPAGLGTVALAAGGLLSAVGAYLFVYVLWRTIVGPAQLRAASARAARAVERGPTGGSRTLTVVAMQSGARRA